MSGISTKIRNSASVTRQILGHYRHGRRDIAKAYADLMFINANPSRQTGVANLLGMKMFYGDFDIFKNLFMEVFIVETYLIKKPSKKPIILDAGGNIGLATLFFKYKYPSSTVHVFEPDPTNFALLIKNIAENKLTDVYPHNSALSDSKGKLTLYTRTDVSGGDIGVSVSKTLRSVYHETNTLKAFEVESELLSDYIDGPIDLLKLDIEGAERLVISNLTSSKKLGDVKQITMEYHQVPKENPLSELLRQFEAVDLYYEIESWGVNITKPEFACCLIRSYKIESK